MAVITQEYNIDLKATGWWPVVEMSQYDTGSRTVVLRVYDGSDLVPLDGCVARIDGRRSDGVEFSASCMIGANSTVSFVVSQEMTRAAGKHVAELVIIDAQGNTAGTQNFILDVEPASMLRDAAASADDRTLYDQYTASIEKKFGDLSNSVNRTVEDISQVIGTGSKPVTVIKQGVEVGGELFTVRLDYDPVTALVTCRVDMNGISGISQSGRVDNTLMKIPADYLPPADAYNTNNEYVVSFDSMQPLGTGRSDNATEYVLDLAGNLIFRIRNAAGDSQLMYSQPAAATWYARGGKYMGVETIGTGGNTVRVGTVTTGAPGTNATVTNSGTNKDVVLDFTIPRGDKGEAGGTIPVASATTLGGIKVGDNLSITDDGTLSATGGASGGFDPTADPIVIGNGVSASGGAGTVAIGTNAVGQGRNSIAIGNSAHPVYDESIAIGHFKEAFKGSIGIGLRAAGNRNGISIGNDSNSDSASVAIGAGAKATGSESVAIGPRSNTTEDYTFSVGTHVFPIVTRRIINVKDPVNAQDAATKAYVDAKAVSGGGYDPTTADSPVIGTNAAAGTNAIHVVAVGAKASADWTNSTALGFSATANGNNAIAIGSPASASYMDSIAIGAQAKATKEDAIAIGSWANATYEDSVAIGLESSTDADSTVSVGNATAEKTRRITNVGRPTGDNDAATKAYVDALEAKLTALEARVAALENK